MARLPGRLFNNTVGTATGVAVGGATATALSPYLQDLINDTWSSHPAKPISASILAEGVAAGVIPLEWAHDEGKRTGYSNERLDRMIETARRAPSVGELFEMRNRKLIGDNDLTDGLEQNGIRAKWRSDLAALRRVLPSVTDTVRMAVREVFDPAARARLTLDADLPDGYLAHTRPLGLDDTDAKDYWAAHWELPSYEQLAQMWFRTDLGDQGFKDALKAADYAPAWREKLGEIARAIPTLTDMIRFAVREVYSPKQRADLKLDEDYPEAFTKQAALHGLTRDYARDYWAAHWQLPSPTQLYTMLWRGLIDEGKLDDALKAADYSPTWRDKLRDIAYHVPGRIDLRRMYAEGLIGYRELVDGYKRLGYNKDDAKMLADFAVKLAEKPPAAKQTHVDKAQTQLWTRLHTSYLAGDTNDAQALDKLATIGVPQNERDDVLRLWKEEREVIRQRLTPAQVKKAWAKAVPNPATGQPWSFDDALAELLSRGWSNQDARTFLAE